MPATSPAGARQLSGLVAASWVAAGAGVVAALAPLARWFTIEMDFQFVGGMAVELSATGFGQMRVDGGDGFVTSGSGATGWTLGGVPDGLVAALIAAFLVMRASRTAWRGRTAASGPSPAIASGVHALVAALGLIWILISWRQMRSRLHTDLDATSSLLGPESDAIRDAVSLRPGIGLFVCAGAFAVALLAGLVGVADAVVAQSRSEPAAPADGQVAGPWPGAALPTPMPTPAPMGAVSPAGPGAPRRDGPPPPAPPSGASSEWGRPAPRVVADEMGPTRGV